MTFLYIYEVGGASSGRYTIAILGNGFSLRTLATKQVKKGELSLARP
jgi:hypothetical protein